MNNRKKSNTGDFIISLFLIIFSTVMIYFSYDIRERAARYPRGVLLLLLLLSIIYCVKNFPKSLNSSLKYLPNKKYVIRILSIPIISFVYIYSFTIFNYYVMTFIFLSVFITLFTMEFKKRTVIIALSTTIILYLVFNMFLNVRI